MIEKHQQTPEKSLEYYNRASRSAFRAIIWVEVGFEGLANLAVSPASKNWTSAVGHHVTNEERAERIMIEGKEMYETGLGKFADFRRQNGLRNDYFTEYNVEHLLAPFSR